MEKIIDLYKKSTFLQGFVMFLSFVFKVVVGYVLLVLLMFFVPLIICDIVGWWSIILIPLYIGIVGGIFAVLDEKLDLSDLI